MKTRELKLSKEGIENILAQGRASFIPLARNRCLCRQDPSMGPLGKRGVRYVRSFAEGLLVPRLKERIRPVSIPVAASYSEVEKPLLKVIVPDLSREVDIKCPYCISDLYQKRPGRIVCLCCGREFTLEFRTSTPEERNANTVKMRELEEAQSRNLLKAEIDESGDARCPRCYHWNFRVSPGIKTCSGCYQKYTAVEARRVFTRTASW
jgi:uncharacterized Zn finger protein (UPF0148 family)